MKFTWKEYNENKTEIRKKYICKDSWPYKNRSIVKYINEHIMNTSEKPKEVWIQKMIIKSSRLTDEQYTYIALLVFEHFIKMVGPISSGNYLECITFKTSEYEIAEDL